MGFFSSSMLTAHQSIKLRFPKHLLSDIFLVALSVQLFCRSLLLTGPWLPGILLSQNFLERKEHIVFNQPKLFIQWKESKRWLSCKMQQLMPEKSHMQTRLRVVLSCMGSSELPLCLPLPACSVLFLPTPLLATTAVYSSYTFCGSIPKSQQEVLFLEI